MRDTFKKSIQSPFQIKFFCSCIRSMKIVPRGTLLIVKEGIKLNYYIVRLINLAVCSNDALTKLIKSRMFSYSHFKGGIQ